MQVTIVTMEPNPLTHGYEYAILNKIQNGRCIWWRIRNLRLAYGDCIGFTNAEYHIVCVDFIYSSRGRLRNLRLAVVVYLGFTNEEYHIVCVDFIYSSRGRLKRDRGFANPLSLSNTSPDPFGDPLRRGILAAAVYANIGFLYPVQTVCPHFDVTFGCFVFGLRSFAFQSGCWACIARFSLLVGEVVCACG